MMTTSQIPPDGGIVYAETNMSQLFPEPLNAITSCFFLAIAIYWTFKLWQLQRTLLSQLRTVIALHWRNRGHGVSWPASMEHFHYDGLVTNHVALRSRRSIFSC